MASSIQHPSSNTPFPLSTFLHTPFEHPPLANQHCARVPSFAMMIGVVLSVLGTGMPYSPFIFLSFSNLLVVLLEHDVNIIGTVAWPRCLLPKLPFFPHLVFCASCLPHIFTHQLPSSMNSLFTFCPPYHLPLTRFDLDMSCVTSRPDVSLT